MKYLFSGSNKEELKIRCQINSTHNRMGTFLSIFAGNILEFFALVGERDSVIFDAAVNLASVKMVA